MFRLPATSLNDVREHDNQRARLLNTTNFKLACAFFGLLFLIVTQVGRLVYHEMRGYLSLDDFPQYYMGGLIALDGAWDSLYPIPNPGDTENPGIIAHSKMRDGYAKLAHATNMAGPTVYIQPPPTALLLMPLALLPSDVCAFVWLLLLCFAAWGIGLQAAAIHEACAAATGPPHHAISGQIICKAPGASRASGLLILFVCLSPLTNCWISSGNMSAIVGWLIGVAALSLIRRNDVTGAAAIFVGAAAKYAPLVLVPLWIAMRRWRALLLCSAMALVLLVASLAIMGTGPYRTFARDILPTYARSSLGRENDSLTGMLLRATGRDTLTAPLAMTVHCLRWATLGLILVLLFSRPRQEWDQPVRIASASVALVAWFLVFSPIAWIHYFAYLGPFWGWLVFQATRHRLRLAAVISIFALCYVPLQPLPAFRAPEPLFSYPLISLVLTLFLAMRTMLDHASPTEAS